MLLLEKDEKDIGECVMKKLSGLCFIGIVCMVAGVAWSQRVLLEKGRAGVVQLGAQAQVVKRALPAGNVRLETRQMEGELYSALAVCDTQPCTKPAIVAELDEHNRVDRMTVFHAAYRTAQGFGVGTPFADLAAAYPTLVVAGSEDDVLYAIIDELGMSFAFPAQPQQAKIVQTATAVSVLVW